MDCSAKLVVPIVTVLCVLFLFEEGRGDKGAAGPVETRLIVRVVSRGAKVIGSGVGGARITVVEQKTGKTLASGVQEGSTGNTLKIMQEAHRVGDPIYSTSDSAHFRATLSLAMPTPIEVIAEAPLGIPHAIQKASKSLVAVPGQDILGEGIVIEVNGLIVEILSPQPQATLRAGQEIDLSARVRML